MACSAFYTAWAAAQAWQHSTLKLHGLFMYALADKLSWLAQHTHLEMESAAVCEDELYPRLD